MSEINTIQKIKLDNGVRVILDDMPSLYSATVSLWIDGSDCPRETSEGYPHGIAHFIEHMAFKGTQNQKGNAVQHIEDSGGHVNALTDKETTCFYAQVLSDEVGTALTILANLTQTMDFTEADVAVERQIIAHEMGTGKELTEIRLLEKWVQGVWRTHPLGQPVIGTEDSIQSMTREKLLNYHESMYRPENMVVSIAGCFNPKEVMERIETLFGSLQPGSSVKEKEPLPPSAVSVPVYQPCQIHLHPDSEQAMVCIGGQGIKASSPQRFALGVLDMILGGGMGSRLFRALRQEAGLVYSVHTFQLLYGHTGLFGVSAQTHPEHLNTVCQRVLNLFDELMTLTPSQECSFEAELERAKRKICGNLLLSMESTRYRASRNARTEIYQGAQPEMKAVQQIIDKISPQDIQALAQQLLVQDHLSYAYTGPVKPALLKPVLN